MDSRPVPKSLPTAPIIMRANPASHQTSTRLREHLTTPSLISLGASTGSIPPRHVDLGPELSSRNCLASFHLIDRCATKLLLVVHSLGLDG
ncbi:unnamed protein product [Taenia asiatica]|uniref:Uncharacterized protein n=1 Tax=Taenia asiatica TaxID=60517 RepID=A0A0R3WCC3_TAEAS|nr:unnamed protein product [Taenia asiatica]